MHKKLELNMKSTTNSIIQLSLPVMLSMLIFISLNFIDTFFISRLGTSSLAAISITFPFILFTIGVSNGLGVGVVSLISRSHKNDKNLKKAISAAVTLSMILGVLSTVLTLLFGKILIKHLTTDIIVMVLAWNYLKVYAFAMFFLSYSIIIFSMLTGFGETKHQMYLSGLVALLNIILDPIMIFGLLGFPKLGISGAALATLISSIVGCVLLTIKVIKDEGISVYHPKADLRSMCEILAVGLPTSFDQLITAIYLFVVNKLIACFGVLAISGYGIAFKLESIILIPAIAISNTSITIIGRYIGNKSVKSAEIVSQTVAKLNIAISLVLSILVIIFLRPITFLFSDNKLILHLVRQYFLIVPISYIFLGIIFSRTVTYQAAGDGFFGIILNLLRTIIIMVPIGYILSRFFMDVSGIWIAIVISSIVTSIISEIWFKKGFRKEVENN